MKSLRTITLTIFIGMTLSIAFFTCKKELPKENRNQSNAKDLSMTDDEFLTKINNFYCRMKSDTLMNDSASYSYDSSLFYLCGSLNFRYGYANANLTPYEKYKVDLLIPAYQENITFNTILGAYRNISNFILKSYDGCSISGKLIHSINVQRQIVENGDGTFSNKPLTSDGMLPVHVSLIIGNTSSSEGSLTSSASPGYFQSYEKYRYNYNGGSCGQNYVAGGGRHNLNYVPWHDMGSARRTEWTPGLNGYPPDDYYDPTCGCQYGFNVGAARQLETGIMQLYSYRGPQWGVDPHNPTLYWTSSRIVWGQILKSSTFIYPANAPNSGTPISGDNNYNPSKIYSYNLWSTSLNDNLPCLDYTQLNTFLGLSYDVAQQYTPSGYSFYGFAIYSGYNAYINYAGSGQLGTVVCKLNRSYSSQSYDSYYDHYYLLMYGRLVQKPADE